MPEISESFRFYVGLATIAALFVISLLALFLLARSSRRMSKRAAEARFSDRQALTLDEFYEQYYAAKKFPRDVVVDVLVRFSYAAHAPAKFLRPDDSFATLGSKSVSDCEQFAVETAVAIRETELRFGVSLFEGKLVTLDDYIRTTVLAQRLAAAKTVGHK